MSETERGTRAQVRGWLGERRPASSQAVLALEGRVDELEQEVQEMRQLNRRLAELMDVVEELLVPLSQQDQEKVRQYLESHSTVL